MCKFLWEWSHQQEYVYPVLCLPCSLFTFPLCPYIMAGSPNKALPARLLLLKYVLELGSSWLMIFCKRSTFFPGAPLAQRLKSKTSLAWHKKNSSNQINQHGHPHPNWIIMYGVFNVFNVGGSSHESAGITPSLGSLSSMAYWASADLRRRTELDAWTAFSKSQGTQYVNSKIAAFSWHITKLCN